MLMQPAERKALQQTRPLANQAVQLACYMLFGVAIPVGGWLTWQGGLTYSYVASTVPAVSFAALATWYILANLRVYAKARHLSYVLPANFLTFATASAVLFVLRTPYSSTLIATCFACTLATSYLLSALTRVSSKPQYIVPGGRIDELVARPNHVAVPTLEVLEGLIEGGCLDGSLVGDLHCDRDREWEQLFARAALMGIPVYHYRQILELETGQVRIDRLSENVLGSLNPNLPYMVVKRMLDIAAIVVLAPLLLPLMLGVAIVIRLDSRGPILFIQDRVGYRGEVFRMIKFRTMHAQISVGEGVERREDAITRDGDDRITKVGRVLRKARIDELPQVWNILKGDMSWIGPRPEAIRLSEWYENEIPFYVYRHIVRPGLTGWAQVNQGHVTDLKSVTAKLRYDFYYVKNISHWLDMLIALKTIRVVMRGLGAR